LVDSGFIQLLRCSTQYHSGNMPSKGKSLASGQGD